MKQITVYKVDRKQYWGNHGTTVEAIKSLPQYPSVKEVRAVWDYRAEGLTVAQARELISSNTKVTNPHGTGGCLRGVRKGRELTHLNASDGKYARMAYERRLFRDRRLARLAVLLQHTSATKWLAGNLTWRKTSVCLPLPDGSCVQTERHDYARWDSGRRNHWPSSTSVKYETTLHKADGSEGITVKHNRMRGWQGRVLVALGLVTEKQLADKGDLALRINPVCTIGARHAVGNYVLAHRLLCGTVVDTVAISADGTAFHGADAETAIEGLRIKLGRKAAKVEGTALSVAVARERWGFCEQGLREFVEATDLDYNGEYTLDEVKNRITDDVRERFADDLAVAGL